MRSLGYVFALGLVACAPARSGRALASSPGAATPAKAPAAEVRAASSAQTPAKSAAAAPGETASTGIAFVDDDLAAARERARREHKALFVDAWAPWCHTCLSMRAYVFSEPSLAPLQDRVVFAAIDTDRDASAAFLERHAVRVWPTFFVLDPEDDTVLGYWPGSASVKELRAFVGDAVRAMDDRRARRAPADDPARDLAEAAAAYAAGDDARAAQAYARAVARSPKDWPRRSEALVGWVQALRTAREPIACVTTGLAHLGEVHGAAMPADFAVNVLLCAEDLPEGDLRSRATRAIADRLAALVAAPSVDASTDDRADALATLAEAREELGDSAGARAANEARLALLEKAAADAKTPEIARTFDYARANAYVALGRADDAVRMLEAREKELPDSYEPPARLARVLYDLGRQREALAAIDRAIAKAYGPRRLRYVALRADILGKLGDAKGRLEALREVVRGWDALPEGQRNEEARTEATRRLREAEAGRP